MSSSIKPPCYNKGKDCEDRSVSCKQECELWADYEEKKKEEYEERKKNCMHEIDVSVVRERFFTTHKRR